MEKRSWQTPKFIEKVKKAAEENPIGALIAGGVAMNGASKLIGAVSGIQSRRAYAKMMKASAKQLSKKS